MYTQQWYMSYSLRAGSVLFRPDPARKLCDLHCKSLVYFVKNDNFSKQIHAVESFLRR